ncbi:MAG: hemolysin III family protein [Cytophagales bacterium]|nr:hemolysin III family protein [Bernardetiaceae bacterium]MDW8203679.1 hemolysin III family protein [Cytophagales bacterium]
MKKFSQEKYEELANAITHGIGALLSLVGSWFLIEKALLVQNQRLLLSFIIYGGGIFFLFVASTLYHSFSHEALKKRLQVIDHVGIYLMIAGTYTPFAMVTLDRWWGNLLLWLVWTIAIAGIIFKIFFTGKFKILSTLIYLGMGWLVVIAAKPMYEAIPFNGILLIVAGGLLFSAGTIFYLWERLCFNHAIWHLFVLGGGICHFFAIFFYSYPH